MKAATHVAFPENLWERVVNGDQQAIDEARKICDGLVLYEHILSFTDYDVWVSIDALYTYNVIQAIRLHKDIQHD